MSDEFLLRLQQETGCDALLGSMLLQFTGGDLEGALQILKSVEKDIFILKGKFIGQTKKYYGTFLLIYNARMKAFPIKDILVKERDKSSIEFDFSKNWREYHDAIHEYMRVNVLDDDCCEKFLTMIATPKAQHYFETRLISRKEINEDDVRNFLTNILINTLGDVNVAVKLKIEKTDIFELNKSRQEALLLPEIEAQESACVVEDASPEVKIDDQEIMILNIEPDISPVGGVAVSKLRKGNMIGVRIIDERPVARYISALLATKETANYDPALVYVPLRDIERREHGVFLTVEFCAGIYGQCYFGEDVKIAVKRAPKKDEPGLSDQQGDKNNIFSKYFWGFGGLLIIVLLALIILIIYNST